MVEANPDVRAVVDFWRQAGRENWFTKNTAFDDEYRSRFNVLHEEAAAGRLAHWMATPEGALGLLLLLDQFPRNCFRGTPRMYATDDLARLMARQALEGGLDLAAEEGLRVFFYLPFSHSENIEDQTVAVEKNRPLVGDYLKHAVGHRDIVERFGRFPHRNEILGRQTTADEQRFLDEDGFKG